jgi:alkylhydroperoxidase family enzyme
MARVKLLGNNEVDPIARELFEKTEASSGRVMNLFRALAHSPKIVRDWSRMGTTILMKGKLSRKLLELAIIRVGDLGQAEYELTAHRRLGLQAGLTQAQIDDVGDWRNSSNFDDGELAILQYTDEVALDYRVSDDTFARIRKTLDEQEIVELTVAIGYYGMVCRTLEALQVDLEK